MVSLQENPAEQHKMLTDDFGLGTREASILLSPMVGFDS
jgi:hypothetical protein